MFTTEEIYEVMAEEIGEVADAKRNSLTVLESGESNLSPKVFHRLSDLSTREYRRSWPETSANRSAYIKSGRMGLVYGQEMPSDR